MGVWVGSAPGRASMGSQGNGAPQRGKGMKLLWRGLNKQAEANCVCGNDSAVGTTDQTVLQYWLKTSHSLQCFDPTWIFIRQIQFWTSLHQVVNGPCLSDSPGSFRPRLILDQSLWTPSSCYTTHKTHTLPCFNPLPTIGNSLKKQKSLYKVLTPSIRSPYKFLWAYGSSWHMRHCW